MEGNTQCSVPGCTAKETDFCIFCKNHYCEEHIFNHECNQSGDDSKENIEKDAESTNNENEDEYNENKCSQHNCNEEGVDYCLVCKKLFCEDHICEHECERPTKNKGSKDADGINDENGEEYNDNKCDFLCCTLEAPFVCPICQQHFCEKHALNHECKETGIITTTNAKTGSNSNNNINNSISNNTYASVIPENSNQENNEEYVDNKCDYLGCTGEAPFFCPICQQHLCANHVFRHDCKQ